MPRRTQKSAKKVCECCGCSKTWLIVIAVISLIVGLFSTYDTVVNYLPRAFAQYGLVYMITRHALLIIGAVLNPNILIGAAILLGLKACRK